MTATTEQHRTLAELAESEQRFATAFHASPMVLSIYDVDGRLVEANQAFCDRVGKPLDDIRGLTALELGQIDHAGRERVREQARSTGGIVRNFELDVPNADGSIRTVLLSMTPISRGGVTHRLVMSYDITERKKSEAALRQSQEILRLFIEHAPAALAMFDRQMRYLAVSRRWMTDFNLGDASIVGRWHYEVFSNLPEEYRQIVDRCLSGEVVRRDRDRFLAPDGGYRWLRWEVRPWHQADGTIGGIIIGSEDITEHVTAEEAFRDRERMLASITNNLSGLVARVDKDLRYRYVSTGYERVLGKPAAEVIGMTVPELLGDRYPGVAPHVERVLTGEVVSFEHHLTRPDGKPTCNLMRLIPDCGADGTVQGYFLIGVEITERVLADERHAQQRNALIALTSDPGFGNVHSHETFQRITEAVARTLDTQRVSIWRFTPDGTALTCLDQYDAELNAHVTGQISPMTLVPENFASADSVQAVTSVDGFAPSVLYVPIRVRSSLAGVLVHEHNGAPRKWTTDEETFGIAMANLVTLAIEADERRQTEAELRATDERFRELATAVQEVFWITTADKTRVLYVSPAYEAIWGRSCESLFDSPLSWVQAIHPDDRERIGAAAQQQPDGSYDEEYRIVRPDGEIRWIRDRAFPVRNVNGQIEKICGVALDITLRKQAEEQLRQAQKMEAIGQLAGGVAHDFNNILTAIMMQADVTAESEHLTGDDREGLQQIRASAQRAANLTRQLLLFSRRQVMQSKVLDVNEVVNDLARMLRRIIGEDVQLRLTLHHGRLAASGDATMLDQVLLNLVVNARDAMPHGGLLGIETSEVFIDDYAARRHPDATVGRYVCLSVSDTGTGISADVLPRIFEPFFTTKPVGYGTGLGLATVFGIVKQHGGWMDVESELGIGTRFRVYLPATTAPEMTPAKVPARAVRGGTETILLVEDEAAVRYMTRTILERRGYRVLEASSGRAALELWERHRDDVQLLLTDLVMPEGMTGKQLATILRGARADLRIIYISGYSAEFAGQNLNLNTGEIFVEKPFGPSQLLQTVRHLLDADIQLTSA